MLLSLFFLLIPTSSYPAHLVFDLPAKSLPKDQFYFVSEIAQGTHKKYELRTSTGRLFLDRVLCPRKIPGTTHSLHDYPTSYGISPGRFNIDRDPLDMIVLGAAAEYRKMNEAGKPKARPVRVIGMIQFDECGEVPCTEEKRWLEDWKVFAVDVAEAKYKNVKEVSDLPTAEREAITEFYANYKGAKKGEDGKEHPQTRVTGYLSAAETLKLVEKDFKVMNQKARAAEVKECTEIFRGVEKSRPGPKADKKYVDCLQRVENPLALPGHKAFDFFLKYNAALRLLSLGEKEVALENAFDLLEARKKKGKTYFRFVGKDLPAPPGTGVAVHEWVETKNRNAGCPEGWPAQHYEARPLVDR